MTGTVLILGASGRFGRACDRAFARAGWQVQRFDRRRDTLMTAAQGVDVIVNGWNPQYPDWAAHVPALHDQVIRAAKSSGATVIVPGNVYVFGAGTAAPWGPATPHRAVNPLGQIRIRMEEAYRASGVQVIVLRAGDFIDTSASGNWFDMILTKGLEKGKFTYPGDPDIPHAWAWLPDLARAAVDLAEQRAGLPGYSDIPFPGFTLSGREMAEALNHVLARPVRLRQMSWLPLQLLRPVWPMARCLLEMRYLWDTPHSLDGAELQRVLPGFRNTPVEDALARAVPPDLLKAGRVSAPTKAVNQPA
jgi:nucleoside-diphosphate-sugar epimerase